MYPAREEPSIELMSTVAGETHFVKACSIQPDCGSSVGRIIDERCIAWLTGCRMAPGIRAFSVLRSFAAEFDEAPEWGSQRLAARSSSLGLRIYNIRKVPATDRRSWTVSTRR